MWIHDEYGSNWYGKHYTSPGEWAISMVERRQTYEEWLIYRQFGVKRYECPDNVWENLRSYVTGQ
jgi:hypothetical protein